MKLIVKFTIWFILFTAIMLVVGGVIVFREIMHNVDNEAHMKLRAWVMTTEEQLQQGIPVNELQINSSIIVKELDINDPVIERFRKDTTGVFPPRRRGEDRKMIIGKSVKIDGKHYYIQAENFVAEPDEIQEGVQSSLITIAIIIIIIVAVLSTLISKIILRPFNITLQAMDKFNIKDQHPLQFNKVNTREFNLLNRFLEKMTTKAVNDYRSLKEFSENASHEIQTPLAVIRGKLELLMGTNITEEQANYINAIQNSTNKLSSVNNSLTFLTKLENEEYDNSEQTDLSKKLNSSIEVFQELIAMKSLSLETSIEDEVIIHINQYLADVLLNNLISNSIRHNIPNGKIWLELSNERLTVRNNGAQPEVSTDEFFKRFKKSNQSADSTGLGLSIVKKICDLHGFQIIYSYTDSLHTVNILF